MFFLGTEVGVGVVTGVGAGVGLGVGVDTFSITSYEVSVFVTGCLRYKTSMTTNAIKIIKAIIL